MVQVAVAREQLTCLIYCLIWFLVCLASLLTTPYIARNALEGGLNLNFFLLQNAFINSTLMGTLLKGPSY